MIVRVVASHPWHKNKNVPRMGTQSFIEPWVGNDGG
jgi:hypothetical protein